MVQVLGLYGFDGSWKSGDDSYSLEGIDPEFYEIDRYDFLQVTQTDEETYDMDLEKSFWIQVNVTDDNKETLASGGDIHIKFNDVDLVIASEWGNE